ncbi:MAG TPA: aldose 1-epimerase [Caldimonas sp.]|jgi:aldose 1-epimerase|nr:aldose 1-epimerase [Caldimonas sp.]HEX2540174.1 aldose 1-epimerase [Caldimonas sp.]
MKPDVQDDGSATPGMVGVERLHAGTLFAEVVPEIGGSLAALYTRAGPGEPRHDWLRPSTDAALQARTPLELASFPLVPWCNRIRDGRFDWNGRRVQLAPNRAGSPHPLHGIGWMRPWRVLERAESWIELGMVEAGAGDWPFPFTAFQRYDLDSDGLTVTLSMRNSGTESMPAGLGHHPYFPHRREGTGTSVKAQVGAMWLSDGEVMPTTLSATHPAVAALREGMRLADFDLDNNFTGFAHEARVTWPDGSALRLLGKAPLDHFVLYCPADKDFFVMEAVSNCTDWINLRREGVAPADTGGAALGPGETLNVQTRWVPKPAAR